MTRWGVCVRVMICRIEIERSRNTRGDFVRFACERGDERFQGETWVDGWVEFVSVREKRGNRDERGRLGEGRGREIKRRKERRREGRGGEGRERGRGREREEVGRGKNVGRGTEREKRVRSSLDMFERVDKEEREDGGRGRGRRGRKVWGWEGMREGERERICEGDEREGGVRGGLGGGGSGGGRGGMGG
ncbi:hypothetical protein Tco_0502386 [Tanacetum coccineum]